MTNIPHPTNEPVLGYLPGSPERRALAAEIARQRSERVEVPLLIGGEEVRTGRTVEAVMPHERGHVLATVHLAGPKEIDRAVAAAKAAHRDWSRAPLEERAAVFLRAAELLAGPWRQEINAATMNNQSKTCHQAEIDAACELIDFLRFNCRFAADLEAGVQPPVAAGSGAWNRLDLRPLEGFVYAVSPFNFTSIALNLPAAPALMGNVAIWKPSPASLLSNWKAMQLLVAAGLPAGVVNFLPGDAEAITSRLVGDPDFAGLHFTGSTKVFRSIWHAVGSRLDGLRNYPRLVGETGGKDFIVAHSSADPEALVAACVRGAFEFQGQKCSAASRAYVPRSLWGPLRERLVAEIAAIRMGDPADFGVFMGAVIHEAAFERCRAAIEQAGSDAGAAIVAGGGCDRSRGWFVEPTLIEAREPDYATMCDELFGPILTVHVYDDARFAEILGVCDETGPYALTGAIFADDRAAVVAATERLRFAAGNFYVNDKPTGAVVGQQPFGGARASGTNDKAGSWLNLARWTSPRTIKETFAPPRDWRYGFLASE